EYEVLNPSYPKETGSNEAATTNDNAILMRHPCVNMPPVVPFWLQKTKALKIVTTDDVKTMFRQ
ncbi:hypothetical protein, partial [Tannerella sp.]|uniref:hypothetical protein n=1 Tax=Tannerella sp. TaxID=2382127 RepID=UPI003FA27355